MNETEQTTIAETTPDVVTTDARESDADARYAAAVAAMHALQDGQGAVEDVTPAPDPASDTIGPLGPSEAVTEDPDGDASPFYLREWRGGPLYGCPFGDFTGRTHQAVVRHAGDAHPRVPEPDIEQRARQAGIILARR